MHDFCAEAARRGVLQQDGSIPAEQQRRIIAENPRLMFPVCETAMTIGYEQIPKSAQQYLSLDPRAAGREMCLLTIRGGGLTADGSIPPATLTRLYRQHPAFGAPFLFAGLVSSYDQSPVPGIDRQTYIKVARRVSYQAFAEGLVSTTSLSASGYKIDRARFRILFARELRRVRGY